MAKKKCWVIEMIIIYILRKRQKLQVSNQRFVKIIRLRNSPPANWLQRIKPNDENLLLTSEQSSECFLGEEGGGRRREEAVFVPLSVTFTGSSEPQVSVEDKL